MIEETDVNDVHFTYFAKSYFPEAIFCKSSESFLMLYAVNFSVFDDQIN